MREELIHRAETEAERIQASGGTFDEDGLTESLAEVNEKAQDPEIWSDPERAREVMRKRSQLQETLASAASLRESADGSKRSWRWPGKTRQVPTRSWLQPSSGSARNSTDSNSSLR